MPRIKDFREDDLSAAQRRVHDAILAGPRGIVEGPLRVWLQSPELAERAQSLGAFCRFGTSLSPALSELAILVTGAWWRAGFEWHAHAPLAVKAGLAADTVEAMRRGETVSFADATRQAVYDFARELVETRRVSAATYARARDRLGDAGLVELVGILGYYTLVAMTIVAFEVPVPPGAAEPFGSLP